MLEGIKQNLLQEDRYKYLLEGLSNTILITVFALIIGLIIGVLIAIIRDIYENTGRLKILNALVKIYLAFIRGTPVVVQLLLIYFGIFASVRVDKLLVAIIAFGINSGAYQAEIFRAGITSIDKGQMEAGRSLGFNYFKTMRFIILPQAIKNILPTLANEFIVLLKETSVAGYIALQDLTKAADIIRSQTFSPMLPLLIVAMIYFVLVMGLSYLVSIFERKLKGSGK